ncbi:MAG TPA: hypothetical protein VIE65_10235 [Methylobacter sp.]
MQLVTGCSFVAFILGSTITIMSSGEVPRVIPGCGPGFQSILDTTRLESFKERYKIGLVCFIQDPVVDIISDKNVVSNLYTIIPGKQIVVATSEIKVPEFLKDSPQRQIGFLAFLVPNEISVEKIKTLQDITDLRGKILDPHYYK